MKPSAVSGQQSARGGDYEDAMRVALSEARGALEHDDVPIGAVIIDSTTGEVVATAHNRREIDRDPTAHAEILAIRQAATAVGDWRLAGYTMVVTLEPCAMCAMAAVWARLDCVVYGAADLKAGAAWSLFNIPQDQRLNHRCDLVAGVLADEARVVLQEFFAERR
jgi:tRNA(adenine34) deaminase